MKNCEFWRDQDEANAMYAKYLSLLGENDQRPTVVEWLYKDCDFALQLTAGDVVQFRLGDSLPPDIRYVKVVQVNRDRKATEKFVSFKTVEINLPGSDASYWPSPSCRIHGRNESSIPPGHFKWPEIPEDLLALMLPKMLPGSVKGNCPFKDEYKDPMPPCMKGGTRE